MKTNGEFLCCLLHFRLDGPQSWYGYGERGKRSAVMLGPFVPVCFTPCSNAPYQFPPSHFRFDTVRLADFHLLITVFLCEYHFLFVLSFILHPFFQEQLGHKIRPHCNCLQLNPSGLSVCSQGNFVCSTVSFAWGYSLQFFYCYTACTIQGFLFLHYPDHAIEGLHLSLLCWGE